MCLADALPEVAAQGRRLRRQRSLLGRSSVRVAGRLLQANQHLFYALASGDARPLARALLKTRPRPGTAQWGIFLRNHDELDLGRLTEEQRQLCFEAFAPEEHMQLYGRGIRRRLAGEARSVKLRVGTEEGRQLANLLTEDHSKAVQGVHTLEMEAYGYRWFRAGGLDDVRKRSAF
jgi:hypothetical protein